MTSTFQATPNLLNDINCNWGSDIIPYAGDLDTVYGSNRSKQRVLRRLLTNPGSYIWEPTYGAGLPSFIGQALSEDNFDQIKSLILSNMFLEDSVSQTPPPQIFIQTIQNGVFLQINYIESPTQNPIVLTFDLNV